MDISDSLYLSVIALFFLASLLGAAILGAPEQAEEAFNATGLSIEVSGETAAVRSPQLRTLCLGSGCIPAVDNASYRTASTVDWLAPGDRVVAVSRHGEAYAFPLPILRFHGVVNTRIGGEPVAVTYSPYSGVPAVVSRRVGDRVLSVEHSGTLYNGNMVMRDRETGTLWSQFQGRGMQGELAGTELTAFTAHVSRWGIWSRNNPSGTVLSRDTGIYPAERYTGSPYRPYRRSGTVPLYDADTTVPPKTVVYGGVVDGVARAYREVAVKNRDVVEDTLGGVVVMVVQDEGRDRILGFRRQVNGTELSFHMDGGLLVDEETESRWTLNGRAIDGPLAGAELEEFDLRRSYWFAWTLFHPETTVYPAPG